MKKFKSYITIIPMIFCIVFLQSFIVSAAEHQDAALYMMRLINDTRKTPLNALTDIGLDKTTAQTNLGMDAWVLDQGLPPLAGNPKLYASALDHANDMSTNLYYSYDSQNGDTVQDRIKSKGFEFISAGESLGILSFDKYIEPQQAAKVIFDNILAYELGDSILPSNRNILNQDRTQIGIAFVSLVADLGLDVPVNIYLVVADFGKSVQPKNFIIGNISLKTIDYPLFKPQNAIEGVDIVLKRLSEQKEDTIISYTMGFFQFEMPFGFFALDAVDKTGNILDSKKYFAQDKNIFFDLFVDN
ncbi:MAG: hypothetical protein HOG03_05520 [Desulfobacula sp.]|jgi:uncharacterized protein YkwD|uniref:CAP domain-containing protein n=1 Tax=Desulfobacula sp. TaxID=2593537 RepID=UPI001D8738C8|nr:hypothetical protein [Desulfobacula sp.]MBT3485999.1 hypothetical protein [Desulfobacula sp.]MBT3804043.1 hypothetical protein [Desulfobacula sp.]MBT4026400.1 hypothetical protein [Desulfobacula sp.]MBT4200452.1 hypothetical protein [Desulfobacula sp.]